MKAIERAEKHRRLMEAALEPINEKLQALLDEHNAFILYQASDGWCIVFDDCKNAPVFRVDFTALFAMSKQDALEYLNNFSI